VAVTHPAYPLSIWQALQIRNHLLLHRPLVPGEVLNLETRLGGVRVLDKGVEIDVVSTAHAGPAAHAEPAAHAVPAGERVWEGLTTMYYRGRFGAPQAPSPLAQAPPVPDARLAGWTTPARGGLRFGLLTGDYNPIHWLGPYARVFGFRRAFHHPQAVLGQCLARLAPPAAPYPHRLDVWIKGPVYYGSAVELRAAAEAEGSAFALIPLSDGRPALLGRWRACAPGSRLDAPPR
jgi:acyl dehydratase